MSDDPFSMLDADDILAHAEQDEGPPPLEQPIPKQVLPGFMRLDYQTFVYAFYLDGYLDKAHC